MEFIKDLFIIVVIVLVGIGCRQKEGQAAEIQPKVLSEDFESFYEKFHTDTVFQMRSIIFPLEGMPTRADSTIIIPPDFRWQKKNWLVHKPFDDMNGTFSRSFLNFNSIIIEKISDNSGLYTMERRFAKLGGEWHLIYYKELSRE